MIVRARSPTLRHCCYYCIYRGGRLESEVPFVAGEVDKEDGAIARYKMCDKLAHRTEVSFAQHSAVTLFQYVLGKSKTEATGCSRYEPCLRIDGHLSVCLHTAAPF